ncbi:uncharacterized protein BP01DRAFT_118378 [Aspergillus saccharolyticus JOP 1030-1]|uniref:Uncharacterized protein n=1 Tax=Aspergillus saccharolyticus JOP 1030-1 TaxID=1450539 RepID=A0A318ZN33_9EURO|nr:hypothetical protein BP01DRAFT_118378 [Aspergillus saccharolyticus JOP 1030-1]PYH49009.1 hypothetical protein BP01DRAFT_118378 [Aspergillus saccharolyticus JOP 1030-1]
MRPATTPFRASSRSNARPQFASTPRFFVSQRTPASQQVTQDADSIGGDDTNDTPVPTARFFKRDRGFTSTQRQKEIIEDSDDTDLHQQDHAVYTRSSDVIFDDGQVQSSSPVSPADEELGFEDLFATIEERKKRRRVSLDNEVSSTQPPTRSDTDWVASSSQDPCLTSPSQPQSPTPLAETRNRVHRQDPLETSPRTPAVTTIPRPSVQGGMNPPSTVNARRFRVSMSHLPPSTQPQSSSKPWISASTQEPASSQRRKPPTFVLPRSPSPSHMDDELAALPTPFSPSSRKLRRRGRTRGPAHTYLPGGMAAEVRSWILETGTRHEQHLQTGLTGRLGADASEQSSRNSSVVVRIDNVHQSSFPSCGPLAFVCGHEIVALDEDDAGTESDSQSRKLLLIGAPRSQSEAVMQLRRSDVSPPELCPGNAIGIRRGLTWDIDLGECDIGMETEEELPALRAAGKWTVVLEWELVPEADGQDSA